MAETIEARVRQKTDTLDNWNNNPLVLLSGEQAFVVNGSGDPVNFKIGDGTKTFAELPFWIDYSQAAYIPYTASPAQDVAYTIVGPGTYGSITVADGYMAVLGWNGSSWSKDTEMYVKGSAGADGQDGTNAQSFNFKGNVPDYASLPASGNIQNDAWYNLGDKLLYVYNGSAYPPDGYGIGFNLQTFQQPLTITRTDESEDLFKLKIDEDMSYYKLSLENKVAEPGIEDIGGFMTSWGRTQLFQYGVDDFFVGVDVGYNDDANTGTYERVVASRPIAGKDAVLPEDLVTKRQLDAAGGGGITKVRNISTNFSKIELNIATVDLYNLATDEGPVTIKITNETTLPLSYKVVFEGDYVVHQGSLEPSYQSTDITLINAGNGMKTFTIFMVDYINSFKTVGVYKGVVSGAFDDEINPSFWRIETIHEDTSIL